jgi:Zn-dependent protease
LSDDGLSRRRVTFPVLGQECTFTAVTFALLPRNTVGWCAAIAQYLLAFYTASIGFGLGSGIAFFATYLVFPAFSLMSVFIHEIGHALAAWVVGWQVHAINVWGMSYLPTRPSFVFEPQVSRDDIGGFVFATSPLSADWARGQVIFILGGPLANLMVAVGCGLASKQMEGGLAAVFWAFATFELVTCIYNLWPNSQLDGFTSDGRSLLAIARGYRPAPLTLAMDQTTALHYNDTDYSVWLNNVSKISGIDLTDPQQAFALYRGLYSVALSRGDVNGACDIWHANLANHADLDYSDKLSHALCLVLSGKGTTQARETLDAIPLFPNVAFDWWRAKVAVELEEGNFQLSKEAAHNAERAAVLMRMKPDKDDRALFRAAKLGKKLVLRPK